MLLSHEEELFFKDFESWQYGPTYDLVFQFNSAVEQGEVFNFLLQENGISQWEFENDRRMRLIFKKPEFLSQAVGLLYFSVGRQNSGPNIEDRHYLVMYPHQFERLCGSDPYIWGDTKPEKRELAGLYRLYFKILKLLDLRFGLKGAYVSDETYGNIISPGSFIMLTAAAEIIELTGTMDDQDPHDTWRLFPLSEVLHLAYEAE